VIGHRQFRCFIAEIAASGKITLLYQVIDHALQSHRTAIVWVINARNAMSVQVGDFLGQNGSAAATKYFDMSRSALFQQIVHVFEILIVTALVAGHGNGLRVLLNGAIDHLIHAAVVTQMDDFATGALDDAAHDIDRGIVAIEKRGGGYNTYFILWGIWLNDLHGLYIESLGANIPQQIGAKKASESKL
jgi:hypothetical protein